MTAARAADLASFAGRHRGEWILVCGCGRSASELEAPVGLTTIGVNDVGRRFTPDYLVVLNQPRQFRGDRWRWVADTNARAVFSQLDLPLERAPLVRFALGPKGGTELDGTHLPHTRNSPYVAVCLAAHLGAERIGLLGVDFTDDHFFARTGRHPLAGHVARIDQEYARLARALAERGVELVNLSAESRLGSLPREALGRFLAGRARAPRVVHVARTNCAGAFWNLHRLFERTGAASSRVVTASPVTNGRRYPVDVLLRDTAGVRALLEQADVVHFHNRIDGRSRELAPFRAILDAKPALLQFHSEPAALAGAFPGRDPASRADLPTLVVAQKQARYFPHATPVPNAVDLLDPLLAPVRARPDRRPRVLYTPTDLADYPERPPTCRGKGYRRTLAVLQRLGRRGVIEPVVRTGLPWKDVMALRAEADVVIDECVTGGYHLTSLEALAQGLPTLAYLDADTTRLVCALTGCGPAELPWVNTRIDALEERLTALAADPGLRARLGAAARAWMERYWSAERVTAPYLRAYRDARAAAVRSAARPRPPASEVAAGRPKDPARQSVPPPGDAPRVGLAQRLAGKARPRVSTDLPQTVRLSADFLARAGSLRGRACHVLGNGPAVRSIDLSLLAPETVLATNAAPLLEAELGHPADYHCVSDRRFLARAETRAIAEGAARSTRVYAGYCDRLPAVDIEYVRIVGGHGISGNVRHGLYHAFSVALFAAQVGLWLGCREVYLHGCELDYSAGRFYEEASPRPNDDVYPQVARNARRLATVLGQRGGGLFVVERSRLVGDFGAAPVPGVRRVGARALARRLRRPLCEAPASGGGGA
jgi:hypothetical protein